MLTRWCLALLGALTIVAPLSARADDVRYYEKDGVTYCETTHTVHRPISETHYEDRQQTVYTEQVQTRLQPVARSYLVPVIEYVYEPYVANRWNPFAQPYQSYHYVPRLHWVSRTEQLQMPVVERQLIPQQQMVKVPITTQRFVDEQQISRVAVALKPTDPLPAANTAIARQVPAGGTPLESDPPRNSTAWRPSSPTQPTIH